MQQIIDFLDPIGAAFLFAALVTGFAALVGVFVNRWRNRGADFYPDVPEGE